MSVGRRKVSLSDASAWIFNRMATAYAARPPYPTALVDAIAELAGPFGSRIGDIGAGTGHLAIPLAQRGFDVLAVEPARGMLTELEALARERRIPLRTLHGTAEDLRIETACLDLVILADAVHFLDKELASAEVARVLAPHGALAIVTCEFTDTPFMRGVRQVMEESAPRRPRAVAPAVAQFSAIVRAPYSCVRKFHDSTPMDPRRLEDILCSISFIGPAMNAQRFARFRERIHSLPHEPVWARTFTLHAGRRTISR